MKGFVLFALLLISYALRAQSPVPPYAKVEKVAGGFGFLEGPVWNDTLGLLFSDMNNNAVYNYTINGKIKVFLKPSDVSNGLTYDRQGRLLVTQTSLRRVVRLEQNGTQTILASGYEGKKLNSPNDIVCKSDGSIYFTDPTFNIPIGQHQELPFSGIYLISNNSGRLICLDSTLALPNGICFSPDEKKLYVNDSQVRIIYVWDVINDSTIKDKKIFATIKPTGYADGMKTDQDGNLYSAGPMGIWVFSPEGMLLDTIQVPETPSNCSWGGPDSKALYITAQTGLYKIKFTAETGAKRSRPLLSSSFQLFANYPNPFNPVTKIRYSIPYVGTHGNASIRLVVYDVLGREIAVLVNKKQRPGNYDVTFNGSGLASGIYFYKLSVGNFSKVKKMIFLK